MSQFSVLNRSSDIKMSQYAEYARKIYCKTKIQQSFMAQKYHTVKVFIT